MSEELLSELEKMCAGILFFAVILAIISAFV